MQNKRKQGEGGFKTEKRGGGEGFKIRSKKNLAKREETNCFACMKEGETNKVEPSMRELAWAWDLPACRGKRIIQTGKREWRNHGKSLMGKRCRGVGPANRGRNPCY